MYSATFDVLHPNEAYDALFQQTGRPPGLEANKVWRLFMDDAYKAMWRDWESVARHVRNELRYLNPSKEPSSPFRRLLEAMQHNPEFRRLWNEAMGMSSPPRLDISTATCRASVRWRSTSWR